MSKSLNIVELIETNPITRLSNTYQNKLLNKIKERFTNDEQQIFIASFYCYLNYQNEFIIDLDDIWKWLGLIKIIYRLAKVRSNQPTSKAVTIKKHLC